MNILSTPRTLLFVPGDRPDRFGKAVASGADAVILDLEDSVSPANKAKARTAVRSWLSSNRAFVRVNPAGTEDGEADLRTLASVTGVSALVLPKAEGPEDVDRAIERIRPSINVVALIESAAGLLAATAIAGHPAVALLAFGNLDFAADCGLTVEPPLELELLPARAQLTYISRASGLPGPVDGVTANISDDQSAAEDSLRAVRLGFSGKLCVHPRQVPVVARAFAPSAQQVNWAERILASVSEGIALVDGAMVDRPVILRAKDILARAARPA